MQPSISDAAVRAKTGKVWDEWFQILDAAGAAALNHTQIAARLHEEHGVSGWWSQMVTVEYERARGLRAKNQTARGFEVNVSKTLPVDLHTLYSAWTDPDTRSRWLGGADFDVRVARAGKSLRVNWDGQSANLSVHFYKKTGGKSQVVVQHTKLASKAEVEKNRVQWKAALERLSATLT